MSEESAFNRVKRCRHGYMIYNRNDRFLGLSLEVYGEYSEGEIDLLRQIVKPGDTVLDIGANIGALTVFFSQAVGPEGVVVAFEPQRLIFQTLCGNIAINSLTNVVCLNNAVGREPGFVHVPVLNPYMVQNFGGLGLKDRNAGERVAALTVDALNLQRCKLIKIDVEGMELDVIEGATHTIEEREPVLYLENNRKELADDLVRRIASFGYRLYWHRPPLYNADNFAGHPENIFGNIISRNMVCLPPSSTTTVSRLEPVDIP